MDFNRDLQHLHRRGEHVLPFVLQSPSGGLGDSCPFHHHRYAKGGLIRGVPCATHCDLAGAGSAQLCFLLNKLTSTQPGCQVQGNVEQGVSFTFRIGAKKTDIPVRTKTMIPVTRCSLPKSKDREGNGAFTGDTALSALCFSGTVPARYATNAGTPLTHTSTSPLHSNVQWQGWTDTLTSVTTVLSASLCSLPNSLSGKHLFAFHRSSILPCNPNLPPGWFCSTSKGRLALAQFLQSPGLRYLGGPLSFSQVITSHNWSPFQRHAPVL